MVIKPTAELFSIIIVRRQKLGNFFKVEHT